MLGLLLVMERVGTEEGNGVRRRWVSEVGG
jgi:hypothetical protein